MNNTKNVRVRAHVGHISGPQGGHVIEVEDVVSGTRLISVSLTDLEFAAIMSSRLVEANAQIWDNFDLAGDHVREFKQVVLSDVSHGNHAARIEHLEAEVSDDGWTVIHEDTFNGHHLGPSGYTVSLMRFSPATDAQREARLGQM